MDFTQFKTDTQNLPLILSRSLYYVQKDKQALLNQLTRWQKKGLIVKLRKGVFLLNKNDRKVTASRTFIANQLYQPSYISMEYALQFHGLIPERVEDVTSITTKKTAAFKTPEGTFVYQHIKPQAYRGFQMRKDDAGFSFFLAEPEKAIVDFLYLNLHKFVRNDLKVFSESYRFQNIEGLINSKLKEYAELFSSEKLIEIVKLFCRFKNDK